MKGILLQEAANTFCRFIFLFLCSSICVYLHDCTQTTRFYLCNRYHKSVFQSGSAHSDVGYALPFDDFAHLEAEFFVDCNVVFVLRFEIYRQIAAKFFEHTFEFALTSELFSYADVFHVTIGFWIIILFRNLVRHIDVLFRDFDLFESDIQKERNSEKWILESGFQFDFLIARRFYGAQSAKIAVFVSEILSAIHFRPKKIVHSAKSIFSAEKNVVRPVVLENFGKDFRRFFDFVFLDFFHTVIISRFKKLFNRKCPLSSVRICEYYIDILRIVC